MSREKLKPMLRLKRKKRDTTPAGCGYMLKLGLLISSLLVINGLLVRVFLMANQNVAGDVRIVQASQFILPVLMIFLEFWLYDFLIDRFENKNL